MTASAALWETAETWEELARAARALLADVSFPAVRAWKERTGGKAIGCFPVYTPQEIVRAAGCLPVTLYGGRGLIEIERADSRIQSFVCSIARSTLELALSRHLDWLDGFVVPSICDVARNLSGIWQLNFPGHFVCYLHLPQNVEAAAAEAYYRGELDRLRRGLEALTGQCVTDPALGEAIRVYNRNRDLLEQLALARADRPAQFSLSEVSALAAAGNLMPRDEHNRMLERAIELGARNDRPSRDLVRVALRGAFCEQPPFELLDVLEEAGCAVVDDDLGIGARFFLGPIEQNGDPLGALAAAYLRRTRLTPVNNPGRRSRGDDLVERCRAKAIQGVVFVSPKFCEPALYDAVLLKKAVGAAGLATLEFQYEEKMSVFETARAQAETFVEAILFFS
jgi:benzoyl-CoA reductase subunit C